MLTLAGSGNEEELEAAGNFPPFVSLLSPAVRQKQTIVDETMHEVSEESLEVISWSWLCFLWWGKSNISCEGAEDQSACWASFPLDGVIWQIRITRLKRKRRMGVVLPHFWAPLALCCIMASLLPHSSPFHLHYGVNESLLATRSLSHWTTRPSPRGQDPEIRGQLRQDSSPYISENHDH